MSNCRLNSLLRLMRPATSGASSDSWRLPIFPTYGGKVCLSPAALKDGTGSLHRQDQLVVWLEQYKYPYACSQL